MFYLPLSFSQFRYFPSSIFYSHFSLLLLLIFIVFPPPHFYCFSLLLLLLLLLLILLFFLVLLLLLHGLISIVKRLLSDLALRPKQNLVWRFFPLWSRNHMAGWSIYDILWRYDSKVLGAERCVIHMRTNKSCCGWAIFYTKHTSTILGYIISLQRHLLLDLVSSRMFVTPIWARMEHTVRPCIISGWGLMTAVKTFQLFLVLRDFVTTQSLITMYLILSGDMNPSPAKVTQHGTWIMKCGLVKKLVKECSLKLIF